MPCFPKRLSVEVVLGNSQGGWIVSARGWDLESHLPTQAQPREIPCRGHREIATAIVQQNLNEMDVQIRCNHQIWNLVSVDITGGQTQPAHRGFYPDR